MKTNSQMKRYTGQGLEESRALDLLSPWSARHIIRPVRGLVLVHQPRSSANFVVRVFMQALLSRHAWLNHWPLVIDSACSLSLLQRLRSGAESSNPLITLLVFPGAGGGGGGGLSNNHLININSGVVEGVLSWITKDVPFTFIDLELFQNWEQKPNILTKDALITPFFFLKSLCLFLILFYLINLFIYLLFLGVLGLHCWAQAFSSCGKRGLLFLVVHGL